ncbi:MAG: DUF1707 SHOCT-like domain-containing protein [Streptosporangiaceae bacterium]
MQPSQRPERRPQGHTDAERASRQDRDTAVRRLQAAFAEERLDGEEFEDRVQAALGARTTAELDRLLADLPATASARPPVSTAPTHRLTTAIKTSTRRRGRWQVPERSWAVAYKGTCQLDLLAAELGEGAKIEVCAYKGTVEILVPPRIRVKTAGFGLTGGSVESEGEEAPTDAPLLSVAGLAYKGSVVVRTASV